MVLLKLLIMLHMSFLYIMGRASAYLIPDSSTRSPQLTTSSIQEAHRTYEQTLTLTTPIAI